MNKKVIVAALAIAALCFLFKLFEEKSMSSLKFLLENGFIMTVAIIFVIVSVFCFTYFVPSKNDDIPLFRCNGLWVLECFLNISTYSAVTSTAINLLKGIYLQRFYHGNYFGNFADLDIYTMTGVSSMLLWFSLFKCWQMLQEAFNYNTATEIART